jgi:hypothetical protein
MLTWSERGIIVTRRMYERRIDQVYAGRYMGTRVMTHARAVGLVRTGKQGEHLHRDLSPRERAALILIASLISGTNLTLAKAAALVAQRQDWVRHAMAVAVTGEDLVLHHAVSPVLTVEVTLRNTVLRDPVLGVGGLALAQEAA